MLKKLKQHLISNYPLLWNTRVIQVLASALIIHILFYLTGFLYPIGITDLWNDSFFSMVEITIFSVLVSFLFLIVWLAFYLRNNPLKSYYTLGKHYLFYEFLVLVLVFFSTSTFFYTYQQGLYDHVNLETRNVDLEKEANIVNLAHHFIAFDKAAFDLRFCCDSIDAKHIKDSIARANGKPANHSSQYPENDGTNYYPDRDTGRYEKSYLYYCGRILNLYSGKYTILTKHELNNTATHWLKTNNKDSVLQLLNQYIALCSKYGVSFYFDPKQHINEVFNDDRFTVRREISAYHDNDIYSSRPDYYINHRVLNDALYKIEEVRQGFWTKKILIFMLYYALGAAIVLFSFRLTRLRHWFFGIIGILLWVILFSLLQVIVGRYNGLSIVRLFVWALLFVIIIINTSTKKRKLITGIAINWVLWFAPFVILIIMMLTYEYTYVPCHDYYNISCPPQPEINVWISENWDTIHIINIIALVTTMWLVFIPLAKKWQANPEE
jgi:hypothetical protein